MSSPTCSVIVSTYNRASYLRRLLAALGRLQDATFEIIVVDGPSTDGTQALLAMYEGRIRALSCPSRNLSHSRNLGIAAAGGDVVVFIDDDALPADERWLVEFASAFERDDSGSVGACGGPVWHRDTGSLEFDGGATSDYGFQVFDRSQMEHVSLDGKRWVLRVPGGNSAYRCDALRGIGGFDEFYAYYLEEADVCLRMVRQGLEITYLSEAGIRHYPGPSLGGTGAFGRSIRAIARSDTYFALKNGADPLWLRLAKAVALARSKHFVREITDACRAGRITPWRWLRLNAEWLAGLTGGLGPGLFRRRRTVSFDAAVPEFCAYSPPHSSRQLRIALLTQTIPGQPGLGGIGRYTFDLAQGLHERGHEVHVVCQDETPVRRENLGFYIHGINADECVAAEYAPGRPLLNKNLAYGVAVVRRLAELYRQGTVFNVVHATNWDCEGCALIRHQVYPTVLMLVSPLVQVIETEQWETDEDLQACVAMDRWQIEHADAVCAPSHGVFSSYKRMGIVPESIEHLRVVPLGIVPEGSPQPTSGKEPRRLLFVGRCERRKGIHNLLEVLPDLLQQHPEWECHLVGNDRVPIAEGGTFKEAFLAGHAGAPWLRRVFFHGIVDDQELRQQYESCDLFVAPSLFESFGLIYHEAMQYGKPVIGCRTGGVPEVVEHEVEGLLVPPDSPDELRSALLRLMGDDALRRTMGSAGAQRVRDVMNYQTMASEMESVYLDTVARVGQERRERAAYVFPRELSIMGEADDVAFSGNWDTVEATPGHRYRVGKADATVAIDACRGTELTLTFLRHSWSSIAEVVVDDRVLSHIDLFKAEGTDLDHVIRLRLPDDGQSLTHIRLKVHAERNPASHASEVWLKGISAVSPCRLQDKP